MKACKRFVCNQTDSRYSSHFVRLYFATSTSDSTIQFNSIGYMCGLMFIYQCVLTSIVLTFILLKYELLTLYIPITSSRRVTLKQMVLCFVFDKTYSFKT